MSLISMCTGCWWLRSNPIPDGAVIPWGFTWHGACGRCGALRTFEAVGTIKYLLAPSTPVSEGE